MLSICHKWFANSHFEYPSISVSLLPLSLCLGRFCGHGLESGNLIVHPCPMCSNVIERDQMFGMTIFGACSFVVD